MIDFAYISTSSKFVLHAPKNPENPAINIHFFNFKIRNFWIVKGDAVLAREFVQPAEQPRAVQVDHKNAVLGKPQL